MTDHQTKYLSEVGRRLRREDFTVQPEYEGLLPIEKDARSEERRVGKECRL